MLLIGSIFNSLSLEPKVKDYLMLKWLPWGKSQCASPIYLCDSYHSLSLGVVEQPYILPDPDC